MGLDLLLFPCGAGSVDADILRDEQRGRPTDRQKSGVDVRPPWRVVLPRRNAAPQTVSSCRGPGFVGDGLTQRCLGGRTRSATSCSSPSTMLEDISRRSRCRRSSRATFARCMGRVGLRTASFRVRVDMTSKILDCVAIMLYVRIASSAGLRSAPRRHLACRHHGLLHHA